MRLRTKIILTVLVVFSTWVIFIQFQEYKYPSEENLNRRLNYIERVVFNPLDKESSIFALEKENPEFVLFSYAYSIYAATNICVKDTLYRSRLIPLIKESIEKVLSEERIYLFYGINESLMNADSIPSSSILYLGHLNLMMGCYRALSSDTTFNQLNDELSASLFSRYNEVEFLNLESYPSAICIPDNTVALASLKLHDGNTGSNYDTICDKWVVYAKKYFIEKGTQTLFSTVHSGTGLPIEEPRGSMLGWSIMFIYQFDEQFAIDLYTNYKEHFCTDWVFVKAFKERFDSTETNEGDIDSGPIFLGYSVPASEFALGCAILADDFKTAKKLERLISLGASTDESDNELKYKVRFLDMNISPMAEALVLFSLTITKWIDDVEP